MRPDFEKIKATFNSIVPTLNEIAKNIEKNLYDIFQDVEHVDKISCRVKTEESFLNKVIKEENAVYKYKVPLKEIQDMIGARIVVYYKSDFDNIETIVNDYFNRIEKNRIVPDDVRKFGYEGLHLICFIPNTIYSNYKATPFIPDFFELQIKTLYQHAWSQSQHGLGYKPESPLTDDEQRKLAFIAAQSWGADTILSELVAIKGNNQAQQ